MNVLLTSCGLETDVIEQVFQKMLNKEPAQIKAMFIPTAAISPDAIEVLPKCLNDLLKCGIAKENIFVYDLHDDVDDNLSEIYDVIYLCGGDPNYLLRRVRERGFDKKIELFIKQGGVVVGVSAGSMIFADDMPNNLGLLQCALDVHCSEDTCEKAGQYSLNRMERIRLGNEQAIVLEKDYLVIIE